VLKAQERLAVARIATLLDTIWHSPDERWRSALAVVDHLDEDGWTILAAWATAANFGPPLATIKIGPAHRIEIADPDRALVLACRLEFAGASNGQTSLIAFTTRPYRVVADQQLSSYLPQGHVCFDPSSLLAAMQAIRDHSGSALLLPPEHRNEWAEEAASSCRLGTDTFRRLLSTWPEIATFL
jgi:hypothetical protein